MDRSSVAVLVGADYKSDEIGRQVARETKKAVFCDVGSVSMDEMVEAGRIGFKPKYKLTLFRYDYNGEPEAELDGQRYRIYRTYLGRGETIELYLEKKAGVLRGDSV